MLTYEQKGWIVNGYCESLKYSCKGCKIKELCNKYNFNFFEYPEKDLDEIIRIIAPKLLEKPKPEIVGERFGMHLNTYMGEDSIRAFMNGLTNTTRQGFKVLSSGVTGNSSTPLMWVIVSRPETPEEAKQTV